MRTIEELQAILDDIRKSQDLREGQLNDMTRQIEQLKKNIEEHISIDVTK